LAMGRSTGALVSSIWPDNGSMERFAPEPRPHLGGPE